MKKIAFSLLLGLILLGSCNPPKTETAPDPILDQSSEANFIVNEPTGDELKIVAVIQVKPEAVTKIKPFFEALVIGSQAEEGCIFYNLHRDINDSTRFVVIEEWKSQAAIDLHNSSEHFKTFQTSAKDMISSLDVKTMKIIY